jgi:bis(5'-adenosyl)-triphosphatase
MENKRVENCPFCYPPITETGFAESENFLAIYNVAPILPGHSLVIPKWHLESLLALTDSELAEMMLFSRSTVKILLETFGVGAFNWTIQEGEAAGQSVRHLHLHLIPREFGDLPRPGDWYPRLRTSEEEIIDSQSRPRLTPAEMQSVLRKIRETAAKMKTTSTSIPPKSPRPVLGSLE